MRQTQYVGLKKEANKWLEDNCVKEPAFECPRCKYSIGNKLLARVYDEACGMFTPLDDEPLYEYETHNGDVVQEVEQCSPWSSGLVIFICLFNTVTGEKMFEWTEKEIEKYM